MILCVPLPALLAFPCIHARPVCVALPHARPASQLVGQSAFSLVKNGQTECCLACCCLFQDLARAMAYLHDHKPCRIIHRDLKPSNILLDINSGVLKIADFGLCKVLSAKLPRLSQARPAPLPSPPPAWPRLCGV